MALCARILRPEGQVVGIVAIVNGLYLGLRYATVVRGVIQIEGHRSPAATAGVVERHPRRIPERHVAHQRHGPVIVCLGPNTDGGIVLKGALIHR